MKLGCSTILYGKHSVDDALVGIKKAGFDGIELCAIPGMGFHIDPNMSEAELRELKTKIDNHGLMVESIGGSGNDPYELNDDSNFKKLLRAGTIVGAPYVTNGSGGKAGDVDDMNKAVDNFNELAEYCKTVGTKVSIKPHVGGAVHDTETSLAFMKRVDPVWIGLNVDPSHIWRVPKWEIGAEAIPKLTRYIFTGRTRDTLSHEQGIGPVETQIPGGGAMDLKANMEAFKNVLGLKIVTVEIVGTGDWALEDIQAAVEKTHAGLRPYC
jgi:sugar phosphate isomerase/epimerase